MQFERFQHGPTIHERFTAVRERFKRFIPPFGDSFLFILLENNSARAGRKGPLNGCQTRFCAVV
jgi:hypothetical protein